MDKTTYAYFMNSSYSVLLQEDIDKYKIVPLMRNHFNIHYVYETLTFIVNDDGTNTISKKFNTDDDNKKTSLYDLPAQITYNFKEKPVLIFYHNAETKGAPTKTLLNYAVNGLLIEKKYYWYDGSGLKMYNESLNHFFNNFFLEKIFDITLDYDESEIMTKLVYMYLKGEEKKIRSIFKDLEITSYRAIKESDVIFDMLLI